MNHFKEGTTSVSTRRQNQLWTALIFAVFSLSTNSLATAQDWNQWRGPARDGVIVNFVAPARLPDSLTQRWKVTVGEGHSSPLVAGSRVFLLTRRGEEEVIACYDLKSGKELWKNAYPVPYKMNPAAVNHGKGPKSTPLLSGGRIYTFGITGILSCVDAATGALKWRKEFGNQFKQTSPAFGTAMSPILDRGLLIIHGGGQDDGALMALDAQTGAVKWSWTGDGPGYSSPVIAEFAQTRQLITQSQRNVISVSPATGELLWKIPFTTAYDQNAITPVIAGNLVIISGLDKGITAYRPVKRGAAWSADQVWQKMDVALYMSSPVVSDGRLYGFSHKNKGQYFCLDLSTGKVLWMSDGRQGDNASILLAKGMILSLNSEGDLTEFPASDKMPGEFRKVRVADSPTWAHPVFLGKEVLVKDKTTLALWGF